VYNTVIIAVIVIKNNKGKRRRNLMKKKILAALLCATMAVSMMACGSASDTASNTDTAAESSEAGADAEATADASEFKIGLVTDVGGVNDQSFNQSAWEGLQEAESKLGVTVNYLESKTDSDYNGNIESFIDEDYDLIICVGYMLADATKAAAEANPDVNFAIIDDASIDLDNVTSLTFKAEQASYLVGYVAGLTTEKNNVGIVLGMASETMHGFGYGYTAGVLDANPECKVQQINANTFSDSAVGKTSANTMITNGADIIFQAAGATGIGVIEACNEAGDGIYAIGVDQDQAYLAPDTVLTSAMKRVDVAVYDTVEDLVNGELKGGNVVYDLAAGGVDIAPTQDLLSPDVISAVEDVKKKIVSGEITVPATQEEFEAAYGDVYELD